MIIVMIKKGIPIPNSRLLRQINGKIYPNEEMNLQSTIPPITIL
jgi:hypothetical protein